MQTMSISTVLDNTFSEVRKIRVGCRGCDFHFMDFGAYRHLLYDTSPHFSNARSILTMKHGHNVEDSQQRGMHRPYPEPVAGRSAQLRAAVQDTPLSLGIYCPSFWLLLELEVRSQSVGCLTVPSLPTLTTLVVDFESGFPSAHHCTILVNLENLPQLSRLEVAWLENDNLTLCGSNVSLLSLSLSHSIIGSKLASVISKLTTSFDEIRIKRSLLLFPRAPCYQRMKLPHLKILELDDSIGFLPFLFADDIPNSLEEVTISIGDQDSLQFANVLANLLGTVEEETSRKNESSVSLIRRLLSLLEHGPS